MVVVGLSVLSCTNNSNPEQLIVAKVGEELLFASDLSTIIPTGIGAKDSSMMAADYIEKWVKQELLIQKANDNLTPAQKNVTRELREYRNSLIIYKYKNELIKQRMDTMVTEDQIMDFYNSNLENFNLNKNIVKAIFIKIPNEVANPSLLKSLTANTSEEGISELKEYCLQYAKGFDIFMDNWVDFETVKNNIPQEIEDDTRFLARNNTIELNDSNYYYLVKIQDYKLKNNLAPVEFVENNIKKLILNKRKIRFLKEVENNIYKEGIRQNKFRIYNNIINEETE
ncbi:MAG: peptidyl-prolyl cis-trans isomerase [Draconibacterium sp.]|nr:peptidyl-prolyl cis-trans isomerase [Draconibacterium sp.]